MRRRRMAKARTCRSKPSTVRAAAGVVAQSAARNARAVQTLQVFNAW
jgi:hypothetical protein